MSMLHFDDINLHYQKINTLTDWKGCVIIQKLKLGGIKFFINFNAITQFGLKGTKMIRMTKSID